jgi:hypothetical protein
MPLLTQQCYYADLKGLTQKDQAVFLEIFERPHKAGDLNAKGRIAAILACIGDDRIASSFIDCLTNRFVGQEMTIEDEAVLWSQLPIDLGCLAYKSDRAYGFLKRTMEPGFWDGVRLPQPGKDSPWRPPEMIRGSCMRGLALSGRSEVGTHLERWKSDPRLVLESDAHAMLLYMAFDVDLAADHGREWIIDNYILSYSSEHNTERHGEWRQTENGKKWVKWLQSGGVPNSNPETPPADARKGPGPVPGEGPLGLESP